MQKSPGVVTQLKSSATKAIVYTEEDLQENDEKERWKIEEISTRGGSLKIFDPIILFRGDEEQRSEWIACRHGAQVERLTFTPQENELHWRWNKTFLNSDRAFIVEYKESSTGKAQGKTVMVNGFEFFGPLTDTEDDSEDYCCQIFRR